MRPYEELERAFAHVPEALTNTRVIAERCSVALSFGTYRIPAFPVPDGTSEASFLRALAEEGAKRKYVKPTKIVKERLGYELGVIEQMGFSGYFLIVADIVRHAKERGITVGPGRGSAAGSIVSYCLDITTLDPLEHGLIFERFLNPERISLPDIDLDFADNRRDEVLRYSAEKYGRDRVVQICTFGTLAARAAVKDVGRAYGVAFAEMNELAKLIPERPGTKLQEALAASSELKIAGESNPTYRKIIEAALKLEGKARHVSVHACGVIITREPTVRYTALQRAPKDDETIITQYEAKPLEDLGLVKLDVLGLRNLTVIQSALENIERLQGRKLDMAQIPLDDPETFALLARAETTGVFQLESAGMRRYLKQLKPTRFEDITAMVSLFRPGPMEWIPEYIRRKHGQTEVRYLHEDLKPILEPTYGIGIYQEQILEIARVFAGYTLGQADLLRRAIGKKIKKELDAQREAFLKGAMKKKYNRALAEKIFDDVVTPFAGYGFNKSHGACYARIAYETAYLKAREPTAFMAAMLSADFEDTDRIALEIEECRAMGIEVLPPDINESYSLFTALPEGKIRFGLAAIKGVGESTVNEIIKLREKGGKFATIEDFARRAPGKLLNKKFIEALAKAGALDSFGERSAFVAHYDLVADYSRASGDVAEGQTDLFMAMSSTNASEPAEVPRIAFPKTAPVPLTQKLQWEKETLGLYVSSHPLAGMRKYVGKKAQLVADFTRDMVGSKITVAGLVEGVKKITTKKGEVMAIVFLEDPTGKIEITLFPRTYAHVAEWLASPDTVLVAGGTLDLRAGQFQVRADAVKRASLAKMIERAKAEGFFDEAEAKRGRSTVRPAIVGEPEVVEALDEEGNVVAGATMTVGGESKGGGEGSLIGDLAGFVARGMKVEEALKELQGVFEDMGEKIRISKPEARNKSEVRNPKDEEREVSSSHSSGVLGIRIHTIALPPEAPKQLLLDLKSVLERFPGKERIQVRIGVQDVSLPLTVTMSTILEKKIDEVMAKYAAGVAKPE